MGKTDAFANLVGMLPSTWILGSESELFWNCWIRSRVQWMRIRNVDLFLYPMVRSRSRNYELPDPFIKDLLKIFYRKMSWLHWIHARNCSSQRRKFLRYVPVCDKKFKGSKNVRVGAGVETRIYGSAEPQPKELLTAPQHCLYRYLLTGTEYCAVLGATPSSRTLAERRPWRLSNRSELQTFLFYLLPYLGPSLFPHGSCPCFKVISFIRSCPILLTLIHVFFSGVPSFVPLPFL